VLDENDNNPYFVGDVSNITVREDAPVGECSAHVGWESICFFRKCKSLLHTGDSSFAHYNNRIL